jgi:hypothetical protein
MSKHHQASRRRSYGRREHELHERPDLRPADGRGGRDRGEALEATVAHIAVERVGGGLTFVAAD